MIKLNMNKVTILTAIDGLCILLLADFTNDAFIATWMMIGGITLVTAAVIRLVIERIEQ